MISDHTSLINFYPLLLRLVLVISTFVSSISAIWLIFYLLIYCPNHLYLQCFRSCLLLLQSHLYIHSIQLMFSVTSFRSRGPRFYSFFSHLTFYTPPLLLTSRPFFDTSLLPKTIPHLNTTLLSPFRPVTFYTIFLHDWPRTHRNILLYINKLIFECHIMIALMSILCNL